MSGDTLPHGAATRRMAEWAATVSRERTLSTRTHAQKGIKDLLGCMIGGSAETVPKRVAQVALLLFGGSGGPCTLVGSGQRVSAAAAAFANGASAHILDFDDSFRPLTGHPSCTIVPAILAVAEEQHASGDDVIDAYVVGVEISAAMGRAAPKHHDVGWHGTATVGVVAAAVACARVLRLDTDGVANAISVAVSASSGSRMQIGYDVKCVQPGAAARDAVLAAYLAKAGIRGNPEVLVGPWGWSKLYAGVDSDGSEYVFPGPGEPLAIVDPGITYKPYPTCGSTHRTLNAVLEMCHRHNIRADDVERIETVIPFLNTQNLRYDRPVNGMQARFSMPYTCAVAVLCRQIRLSDFEDAAIARPDVQALMERVSMRTLPGSEHTDKTYLEMPCYTKISLRSGRVYEDERYDRRGESTQPLTTEEERFKFEDCTRSVLTESQRKQILALLENLGSVTDVAALTELLR
ncbi:MmgE/PrpD [Niveomyces insectorum RCEF 264]|uniref:MmgE/PrpD n=1 Tax=Niveomyces insectorum RCEF 264 TaxID=1081102 RepID=A0A167NSU6_9HYPO|nr:MmgE/PrpD [Niveomyces insectorum RCEF 264]